LHYIYFWIDTTLNTTNIKPNIHFRKN
jgi:hypothetical protein